MQNKLPVSPWRVNPDRLAAAPEKSLHGYLQWSKGGSERRFFCRDTSPGNKHNMLPELPERVFQRKRNANCISARNTGACMPWVRIDDRCRTHPKIQKSGTSGFALWVSGLQWCNENSTNGDIPKSIVPQLWRPPGEKFQYNNAAKKLVEAGLWVDNGDSYSVHDYLEYQPARDQIKAKKERNAERQRRHRGQTSGEHRANIGRTSGKHQVNEPNKNADLDDSSRRDSQNPNPNPNNNNISYGAHAVSEERAGNMLKRLSGARLNDAAQVVLMKASEIQLNQAIDETIARTKNPSVMYCMKVLGTIMSRTAPQVPVQKQDFSRIKTCLRAFGVRNISPALSKAIDRFTDEQIENCARAIEESGDFIDARAVCAKLTGEFDAGHSTTP